MENELFLSSPMKKRWAVTLLPPSQLLYRRWLWLSWRHVGDFTSCALQQQHWRTIEGGRSAVCFVNMQERFLVREIPHCFSQLWAGRLVLIPALFFPRGEAQQGLALPELQMHPWSCSRFTSGSPPASRAGLNERCEHVSQALLSIPWGNICPEWTHASS